METDKPENQSKKQRQFSAYAKYSGLAIQMGVAIGFFTWLGTYLDESQSNEKPIWTIILSLLGIAVALYIPLKDLISNRDS